MIDDTPRHSLPSGFYRILTFGHARNKGVDRLLHLLTVDSDARLSVICPTPIWAELWEPIAIDLGVTDRVRVLSDLSDAELAIEYRRADVFCMVSKYEGYGLPVAESLYLGRPTVISSLPVLDATARGRAIVVDETAPDGLADAIAQALETPRSEWDSAAQLFRAWGWSAWVSRLMEEVE